ncbi:hypothetical protein ACU4GD_19610 [Cupriavidus basilensis]
MGELVVKVKDGTPAVYKDEMLPARQQLFSVLRTGTGDLDLISGGDFTMTSPFGVYTAGTQSANVGAAYNLPRARDVPLPNAQDGTLLGADGAAFVPFVDGGGQSMYRAWYPERGGNVLVRAQGDVKGDLIGGGTSQQRDDAIGTIRAHYDNSAVGNWLWRQGTGSAVAGSEGVPAAWWVNFGSYVAGPRTAFDLFGSAPFLVGFTGIGTLGGGNLVLETGGDAGMLSPRHGCGRRLSVAQPGPEPGRCQHGPGLGRWRAAHADRRRRPGHPHRRWPESRGGSARLRDPFRRNYPADPLPGRAQRPQQHLRQPARRVARGSRLGGRHRVALRPRRPGRVACLRRVQGHVVHRRRRAGAGAGRRRRAYRYARRPGAGRGRRRWPGEVEQQWHALDHQRHPLQRRGLDLVLAVDTGHRHRPVQRGRQYDAVHRRGG